MGVPEVKEEASEPAPPKIEPAPPKIAPITIKIVSACGLRNAAWLPVGTLAETSQHQGAGHLLAELRGALLDLVRTGYAMYDMDHDQLRLCGAFGGCSKGLLSSSSPGVAMTPSSKKGSRSSTA